MVLCAPAKRGRASGPKRRWPSHSVAHESGRPTPGFGSDVETTRRTARVGAFTARVCSASGSGRARDGLLVLCASRWRLRASCPKRRWPSHSVAHESGPSEGSRTTGFGLSALAGGKEFVIPESHPGIGADVCACMRAWAVRAVYGSLGESSRAIVGSSIVWTETQRSRRKLRSMPKFFSRRVALGVSSENFFAKSGHYK